jgi:hypothetical protein
MRRPGHDLALVSLLHFVPCLPRCVLLAAGFRGGGGVKIEIELEDPETVVSCLENAAGQLKCKDCDDSGDSCSIKASGVCVTMHLEELAAKIQEASN